MTLTLLSSLAPISAQTSASNQTHVQGIVVRGTDAAMEVEIQTSGTSVAPDTQAITGPDRIVVDFPGALPSAELRALNVNRGALKGVRAGLFFKNPPITRIVLDLAEPQSYQISTIKNAIVVKLSSGKPGSGKLSSEKLSPEKPHSATSTASKVPVISPAHPAKLENASLPAGTNIGGARLTAAVSDAVSNAVSDTVSNSSAQPIPPAVTEAPPPPKPAATVTFESGMLRIHAEKATLAQVLFEVQRQTQAEIAIPAGAEQEEVFVDLGPAPARDVLASLLNGSPYNFIFVGSELALECVILTRRDPNSIF